MNSPKISVSPEVPAPPSAGGGRADILLVGLDHHEAQALPPRLFGILSGGTAEVQIDALDRDALDGVMVILSPVVARTFDAIDMAEKLAAGGFTGRYIAYAPQVADEELIRSEVSAVAPTVAFDIVTMGSGPRLVTAAPTHS